MSNNLKAAELKDLLSMVQQGSQAAAWEIIDRYGSHVLRVVRRSMHYRLRTQFDSQDFVQMAWASFFRHPTDLHSLQTPQQLVGWLTAIARNKVIDEVRRRLQSQNRAVTREVPIYNDTEGHNNLVSRDPTPSAVAIARERWDFLLKNQPAHVERILEMRLGGATYREIGEALNLHERTIRKAVERLLTKCHSWAVKRGA